MIARPDFQVGDWVTQYSAGFWQVMEILPKYADEDYSYGDISWKKGEQIGWWTLLKKALTPKMKLRIACEVPDAEWVRKVSEEQRAQIEEYFESHPKDKQKFDSAPWQDEFAVSTVWLRNLSDEEFAQTEQLLQQLPEKFTMPQFDDFAEQSGLKVLYDQPDGGEKCTIFLFSTLYRTDEERMPLIMKWELRRFMQ